MIESTLRGVAASGVGTLAMDASLYRRYRHDGGNADFPGTAETQRLIQTAMQRGFQTREAEMELTGLLGELGDEVAPSPRRR